MRFLFGCLVGVGLTVGAAYLHDFAFAPTTQDMAAVKSSHIVNWDTLNQTMAALTTGLREDWTRLSKRDAP